MSSAWLLPEHIADVLPARARHIESLRRGLLDTAAGCGFELEMEWQDVAVLLNLQPEEELLFA